MMEAQAGEGKTKRRPSRREFKLRVVKWYMRHGENKAQTAYRFNVHRKRVREWVQNEEMIRETKKFVRKVQEDAPSPLLLNGNCTLILKILGKRGSQLSGIGLIIVCVN